MGGPSCHVAALAMARVRRGARVGPVSWMMWLARAEWCGARDLPPPTHGFESCLGLAVAASLGYNAWLHGKLCVAIRLPVVWRETGWALVVWRGMLVRLGLRVEADRAHARRP